jgi:hypothetical protein
VKKGTKPRDTPEKHAKENVEEGPYPALVCAYCTILPCMNGGQHSRTANRIDGKESGVGFQNKDRRAGGDRR